MEDINNLLSGNQRFKKLAGPLRAAQDCDEARLLASDRFTVISFREGLLTVGVGNSAAAGDLRFQLENIKKELNTRLGSEWVERVRIKLV